MNKVFFGKQIDRLRSVYSPASLNEERVKVLWERFKLVEDHQFESALNFVIGECTTPALPAISRIVEAVAMFSPSSRTHGSTFEEHPYNPHAKRLADEYAPKIIAMLRGIGKPLPYNPSEREE